MIHAVISKIFSFCINRQRNQLFDCRYRVGSVWDSGGNIGWDSRLGHDSRSGSGRILKCIWAGFQSRIRWDGWSSTGVGSQNRTGGLQSGGSKADQMVLMGQNWGTMDTVESGGIPEWFLLSVGSLARSSPWDRDSNMVTPSLTLILAGITTME